VTYQYLKGSQLTRHLYELFLILASVFLLQDLLYDAGMPASTGKQAQPADTEYTALLAALTLLFVFAIDKGGSQQTRECCSGGGGSGDSLGTS